MATQPLAGITVLVTRPRETAGPLVAELRKLGATVLHDPVLSIGPPPDPAAVADVLSRLGQFDWLVFVSQTGVRAFLDQLRMHGNDLNVAKERRVAAIGPATAAALTAASLAPSLVAGVATSEGLIALVTEAVAGQRVLLIRADRGRDLLQPALAAVATVEQVAFYHQVEAPNLSPKTLAALQAGTVALGVQASSESARVTMRFLRQAGIAESQWPKWVAISPITAEAIQREGGTVGTIAATPDLQALLNAVLSAVGRELT